MNIIYISLTGQTRKFVHKLNDVKATEIKKNQYFEINEPYIVILPTYDYQITCIIDEFIDFKNNRHYLKGVCGSGNLNFNELFCFSAKELAEKYHVPLIHLFEFSGNEHDVRTIENEVNRIGKT